MQKITYNIVIVAILLFSGALNAQPQNIPSTQKKLSNPFAAFLTDAQLKDIENQIAMNVEEDLKKNLEKELQDKMQDILQQQLQQNLQGSLKKEVENIITRAISKDKTVVDEFGKDLQEKLKQFALESQAQYQDQVIAEINKQIDSNLYDQVEEILDSEEIQARIMTKIQEDVNKQISDKIQQGQQSVGSLQNIESQVRGLIEEKIKGIEDKINQSISKSKADVQASVQQSQKQVEIMVKAQQEQMQVGMKQLESSLNNKIDQTIQQQQQSGQSQQQLQAAIAESQVQIQNNILKSMKDQIKQQIDTTLSEKLVIFAQQQNQIVEEKLRQQAKSLTAEIQDSVMKKVMELQNQGGCKCQEQGMDQCTCQGQCQCQESAEFSQINGDFYDDDYYYFDARPQMTGVYGLAKRTQINSQEYSSFIQTIAKLLNYLNIQTVDGQSDWSGQSIDKILQRNPRFYANKESLYNYFHLTIDKDDSETSNYLKARKGILDGLVAIVKIQEGGRVRYALGTDVSNGYIKAYDPVKDSNFMLSRSGDYKFTLIH